MRFRGLDEGHVDKCATGVRVSRGVAVAGAFERALHVAAGESQVGDEPAGAVRVMLCGLESRGDAPGRLRFPRRRRNLALRPSEIVTTPPGEPGWRNPT
ncbi:hypothetical protein [Salinibacterium xinjiangense]|uniref:hypothetical protein n=1 Tax=Salinibacterium xinjiangense TaxID=386302 RepID=UPI001E4F9D62|nr:hypothetical protein [Salinibacterium xinjiangense]